MAEKQRAFQGELQAALSGVAVTAVGRIGDFDRALEDGTDAALSLPAVLVSRSLSPLLRGWRQGASSESYALVAADTVPNAAHAQSVGALNLLGRDGTTAFVGQLLGSHHRVEGVSKVEDLLPLLQMQRVDAILLPARFVPELKATSRMNLMSKELAKKVELPAVAKLGSGAAQVMTAVSNLRGTLSKSIGVDEWR